MKRRFFPGASMTTKTRTAAAARGMQQHRRLHTNCLAVHHVGLNFIPQMVLLNSLSDRFLKHYVKCSAGITNTKTGQIKISPKQEEIAPLTCGSEVKL